jgi:DNA-binding MarR family transcriptional regulator
MDDVKGSGVDGAANVGTAPPGPRPEPFTADALETSKLLVEVLQVGYPGRRGGSVDGGGLAHGTGSVTSHLIRAAIHIYGHGPQTIGQLAEGLGISQGWASRVVDEMERAGYLARERDPQDRRVVRVSLVPEAVARVESAYRWRGDAVEGALEGMTDGERAALRGFLRRFSDGVGERA